MPKYKVGIIARGRGYRSILTSAPNKAIVGSQAKKWLEHGSVFGVFANEKEEADWLKKHGY